ncbi:RICIN domain-containing protein [Streptosporangium sp. NBC_01469]|uniref:RICIN domain-containing protein n=1 Tax=Streptosporangium sp. NBC_01469 TaxID=2903898 RepID=UPI002E2AC608|nr:RICIN domain-containing protein [Streptosporangium sp. NBC_01469]
MDPRSGRKAKRMLFTLVALVTAATIVPATSAQADGIYRWRNQATNGFLEIWLSSLDDLAKVITWDGPPSNNQAWMDFKLDNGYYSLTNYNSGKTLDRWDSRSIDSTGGCGHGIQYQWTGQQWQQWKYRRVWDSGHRRDFIMWKNQAGCFEDPYHDVLSADAAGGMHTTLYHTEYCDYTGGPYWIVDHCKWKRNGE